MLLFRTEAEILKYKVGGLIQLRREHIEVRELQK